VQAKERGSGFIFDNIDYTEAGRLIKAAVFSLLCFVSFCASVTVLFLSGRHMAREILKILGLGNAHNKSLDASGGSVFLNLIRPAMLD
jgi:hypothetical protein